MKIRVASNNDIPILIKMGSAFIHESPTFKQRGFDPDKAARHFKWLLDGNGVIFLAVHDGQIVGGFVGGITTDWQSDHKLAFDYVMYVMPKFRSSGVAKLLVETFIRWAKEMGADRINCGTATMVNTKHCIDLYSSLGFSVVGAFLEMEI
ncbi:GNAT family N-acetyltransferase [Acinetobacter modestus]|uniref:GNAT family N-acetyltransferase n=1 Tax=Acinetobacter modestus TaxID=1776740 RepID=UPI0020306894|nr:GNAT family N-acetyltransferase [Acinetobacter modestus]MCM1957917.1 GNAT family N-acetyltransferase [Acinetobacter modestus]